MKQFYANKTRFAFVFQFKSAIMVLAVFTLAAIVPGKAFGQAAPNISYSGSQTYYVNTSITALKPVNSGGAVPAAAYGQVATIANLNNVNVYANGLTVANNGYIYATGGQYIFQISSTGSVTTGGGPFTVNGANFSLYGLASAANFLWVQTNPGLVGLVIAPNLLSGVSAAVPLTDAMAVSGAKKLYFADTYTNGKVYSLNSNGRLVTIAGGGGVGPGGIGVDGTGAAASFASPAAIAAYTNPATNQDFIYVADYKTIRQVTAAGVVTTIATGFKNADRITVDNLGNIYVFDAGNYQISRITSSGAVFVIAGGPSSSLTTDGFGTGAGFSLSVTGLAADNFGNVYDSELVPNATATKIRKITPYGYSISPALPAGLSFDRTTGAISGSPSVAGPSTNYTVTAYNSAGVSTTTVNITVNPTRVPSISYGGPLTFYVNNTGQTPVMPANTGSAVPSTAAYGQVTTLAQGAGNAIGQIAVNNLGDLYVPAEGSDGSSYVYEIAQSGATFQWGGPFPYTQNTTYGFGGLAIDGAGNLYAMSDANHNQVGQLTGVVPSFANTEAQDFNDALIALGTAEVIAYVGLLAGGGEGELPEPNDPIELINSSSFSPLCGAPPGSDFSTWAMAAGKDGTLYFADPTGAKIYKVPKGGAALATFIAGGAKLGGLYGDTPVDGTGASASFSYPDALAVDSANNIYVADNGFVRKVTTQGVVTTLANNVLFEGGTITSLTVDGLGNIYAYGRNQLVKITPAGIVTAVAGMGNSSNTTTTDGTGTAAGFGFVNGLAADNKGNMYDSESGASGVNPVIRHINLTGYTISPALPAGLGFNGANGAIYGVPTAPVPAANYTVTAFNVAGSGSTTVSIGVQADNVATLSSLTIGSGTLSPAFATAQTAYVVTVPNSVSSIALTPTTTDPVALASANGTAVASGAVSSSFSLVVGPNTINTVVTARNGVTKMTYSLTVIRLPLMTLSYTSPHTYLKGVAIGPLTPDSQNIIGAPYNNTPVTLISTINTPTGIAVDAAGNLYVGDDQDHEIFDLPAGASSALTLNSYSPGSTYIYSPDGIAVDNKAGNIYFADGVQPYPNTYASSALSVLHAGRYQYTGSGFSHPAGLAVDAGGDLFVADLGNNAIKEIMAGTGTIITLASNLNGPSGVAVDGAGNVYFTDTKNNLVKMIPAGSTAPISIGTGSTYSLPIGIAVDGSGNVYVGDSGNNVVKEIPAGGGAPFVIGSGFNNPRGVAIDANGNIYVGDYGNNAVKEITRAVFTISPSLPAGLSFSSGSGTISGTATSTSPATPYTITATDVYGMSVPAIVNITVLTQPVISYQGPQTYNAGIAIPALTPVVSGVALPGYSTTPGVVSALSGPTGVATDLAGNVYLADQINNNIDEILAGTTTAFIKYSGFNAPRGIATDAAGNLYVADEGNKQVKKISANGTVNVLGGTTFNNPIAVTVDLSGNVYVSDFGQGTGSIKEIPIGGGGVITLGTGYTCLGLAADAAGNVYFAEAGIGQILKIPASHSAPIVLVTGLTGPQDVIVDAAGNLFIADTYANAVRELPSGAANTTSTAVTSASMITLGAGFKLPVALAQDPAGNVYVTDYTNNAIKMINPTGGYYIAPFLPAGLTFNATSGVISGTPTVTSPATNYIATGYNAGGNGSTSLNISVSAISPVISYTSPQTFSEGIATSGLSPVASGVAAPGYNNTPLVLATVNSPGGITRDMAGNIYVSNFNAGTIYMVPAGGGAPVQYATGFNRPSGLAADPSGDIFVAESGTGLIKKILPGGSTVSALALSRHFTFPIGLAMDLNGNLYVTDGGIYEIPAGTSTVTQLGAGAFSNSYSVTVDAAGNVYASDINNGVVKELPAGGGTPITLVTGLNGPEGVSVDNQGDLYFADTQNNLLKEIPYGGTIITIGSGFHAPTGTVLDGAGNVYLLDFYNNVVKEVTPVGGFYIGAALPAGLNFNGMTGAITGTPAVIAQAANYTVTAYNAFGNNMAVVNIGINLPSLPIVSYSGPKTYRTNSANSTLSPTASGVATLAYGSTPVLSGSGFTNPALVSADASGDVYIADAGNNTVTKIPAGGGSPVNLSAGLTFAKIGGIAADAAGNVYVSDETNNSVTEILTGGGTNLTSGFNLPIGVAVDLSGNLYVADYNTSSVKKILAGSSTITTIATGFSGANGIAADAYGNIYVANTGAATLVELAAGTYAKTTISSNFYNPVGVAVDASGNIFVADKAHNTIYKIIAGSTSPKPISSGFDQPGSVAVDGFGNVYVTDQGSTANTLGNNGQFKEIVPIGGYFINTALPAGLSFSNTTGAITGRPSASTLATNYKITAYNVTGSSSASLSIVVTGPPNFSYNGPQTYFVGAGVTLAPVNSGSPATLYSIAAGNPALPAGLILSGATGTISGTATAANAATTYTITAANTMGSSTATVNLTVNPIVAPTVKAAVLTFTNTTTTSTTLSWTSGNGASRAVFMEYGNNGSASPVNSTSYMANSAYGSGTQIGTTGWYCIYNGAGSSVNITGLAAGTTYRATVVEYNGSTAYQVFSTSGMSPASVTTSAIYPTQAAMSLIFTGITSNGATVSWTNGTGTARAAFVFQGSNGSAVPTDGLTYNPGTAYGTGTEVGTSGWYCFYNGTGSTANITGLAQKTTYRVTVVEYNTVSGVQRYLVTALDPADVTTGLTLANGFLGQGIGGFPLISSLDDSKVIANNILSPNGDGVNDTWIVKNLEFYPNNKVTVYDRAGNIVYAKQGYMNDWAGTYHGNILNQGTYYYLVDLGNGKKMTGFITVVRDR